MEEADATPPAGRSLKARYSKEILTFDVKRYHNHCSVLFPFFLSYLLEWSLPHNLDWIPGLKQLQKRRCASNNSWRRLSELTETVDGNWPPTLYIAQTLGPPGKKPGWRFNCKIIPPKISHNLHISQPQLAVHAGVFFKSQSCHFLQWNSLPDTRGRMADGLVFGSADGQTQTGWKKTLMMMEDALERNKNDACLFDEGTNGRKWWTLLNFIMLSVKVFATVIKMGSTHESVIRSTSPDVQASWII